MLAGLASAYRAGTSEQGLEARTHPTDAFDAEKSRARGLSHQGHEGTCHAEGAGGIDRTHGDPHRPRRSTALGSFVARLALAAFSMAMPAK